MAHLSFNDFLGNSSVIQTLSAMIRGGRLPHALLLCGEEGLGKRTLAQMIAAAYLCEADQAHRPCGKCAACSAVFSGTAADLVYIRPPAGKTTISVEQIREVVEDAIKTPRVFSRSIYLIEQAHLMTQQAQNALLKSLEEPSEWAVFILLASDPQALLATIRSRTVALMLSPVSAEEAKVRLRALCPGKKDGEYLAAAQAADGNIGLAMDFLLRGEYYFTCEHAKAVLAALRASNEFETLALLSREDKNNARQLLFVLQKLLLEEVRLGRLAAISFCGISDALDSAQEALAQNVNYSLVTADLCSRLFSQSYFH